MLARTTPEMEFNEVLMMHRYIGKDKPTFFEWGSGGSTVNFAPHTSRYVSIEHYDKWYELIKPLICDHVEYELIPNNNPRSKRDTPKEDFLDYVNAVDRFQGQKFDLVLVDGRARKYCAERALSLLHQDSYLFIHDWGRERYTNHIMKYYDIVEVIEKLACFKPKK